MIADLTDPMITRADAEMLFSVLLKQFASLSGSKLAVFDEVHTLHSSAYMRAKAYRHTSVFYHIVTSQAHRYLSADSPLADQMVDRVRLMRHEGMRVLISTQNPAVLRDEMLELLSIAVVHRFHASDWFKHLARKLPMPDTLYDQILELQSGEALVFAKETDLPDTLLTATAAKRWYRMRVRERLTLDAGRSVTG